jgi:amino acid permease
MPDIKIQIFRKEKIMFSKKEKLLIPLAMLLSCAILSLVSFVANWENIPPSQKEILIYTGLSVTFLLIVFAASYLLWFFYSWATSIRKAENAAYEERMQNQFNVGQCISPRHWLDADDYRRLAVGSRK